MLLMELQEYDLSGIYFAFQYGEIGKRPGEYGIQRNCIKEV